MFFFWGVGESLRREVEVKGCRKQGAARGRFIYPTAATLQMQALLFLVSGAFFFPEVRRTVSEKAPLQISTSSLESRPALVNTSLHNVTVILHMLAPIALQVIIFGSLDLTDEICPPAPVAPVSRGKTIGYAITG